MKKILAIVAAIFVLTSLSAMAEMTADEIIAKHLEAYGGADAMRNVKSIMLKGSMFMQGMPLEMTMYAILPDKSFAQVSTNNMVLGGGGTNGKEAWATQMGQTFILTGKEKAEAEKQADQFGLLDYAKKGATAKYLGEDMVKGAKAYKVEFVDASKDTTVYFFDATTYYIVREKSSSSSQSFSGHKKFGGIVFPAKITASVEANGQTMQQMITIDTIAINIPVADSLFVMPKDAKPMPTMPTGTDTAAPPAKPGEGK